VNSSDLKPARKTSENTDYNTGTYYSDKSKRNIQYESGIEYSFILKLESFPRVKFYVEQPKTIEYTRNNKNNRYTPDFAVFLDSGEVFFVETKDFTGMSDARVHKKMEALIDFCKYKGFGVLLMNQKESIKWLFKYEFNIGFRDELKLKLNENGGRTIFFAEFSAIKDIYKAKWTELLAIVLTENWSLYPFPFKLCNRNPYQKFRETFVK
jgi:hypothetical protein